MCFFSRQSGVPRPWGLTLVVVVTRSADGARIGVRCGEEPSLEIRFVLSLRTRRGPDTNFLPSRFPIGFVIWRNKTIAADRKRILPDSCGAWGIEEGDSRGILQSGFCATS